MPTDFPRIYSVWLIVIWRFITAVPPFLFGLFILQTAGTTGELIIGLLLFAFAAFALITAYGVYRMSPWGRVLEICCSIMGLLAFPLGTVISALILWYLFKPEALILFGAKPLNQLSEAQQAKFQSFLEDKPNPGCWIAAAVVAVSIGFGTLMVSAIAIPNLLNAIDRGKQKRAMADLRDIGQALEQYAQDTGSYPDAYDMQTIRELLEDRYIQWPTDPAWGHPYQGYAEADQYLICSPGKDGGECDIGEGGPTLSFDAAIVYVNGEFYQYPDGINVGR